MSILALSQDGLYSGVVAWNDRDDWLGRVRSYFATGCGRAALRRRSVSLRFLMAVAAADAAAADDRTGRGLATANETVARTLGGLRKKRQVQRARAVLEDVGLAVTVAPGRYLTARERRLSGGRLRRPAVRALTHPRPTVRNVLDLTGPASVGNVALPRRGESPRIKSPSSIPTSRPVKSYPQVPLRVKLQAAAIDFLRPGILRGRHPDALGRVLMAAGVRPDVPAAAVLRAADAAAVRYPATISNPLGMFRWALSIAAAWVKNVEPVDDRLARAGLPPRTGFCTHRDPFGHGWCVVCGDPIPAGQDGPEPGPRPASSYDAVQTSGGSR